MFKKKIIWILVIAFLNFVIVPDYVFADCGLLPCQTEGSSKERSTSTAWVVGGAIVLGLIIGGIVLLAKHSRSSTDQSKEQKQDPEMLPNTNLYEQLITPSGQVQVTLLRW